MKIFKHILGVVIEATLGMSAFYVITGSILGIPLSFLQVVGVWVFALVIHCPLMFVVGMAWTLWGGSSSEFLQKSLALATLALISSSLSALCVTGFPSVAVVSGMVFGTCSLVVSQIAGPIDTRYNTRPI